MVEAGDKGGFAEAIRKAYEACLATGWAHAMLTKLVWAATGSLWDT